MPLVQPSAEVRSKIIRAYSEAAVKFSATSRFTNGITILGDDLLVIKCRDYPPEIMDKLRDFAREIVDHFGDGLKVVLCPMPADIKEMHRDDAVTWLRELARAVDCDVFDPQEPVEPIVFPKLSEEKLEEFRQAMSQGTITPVTTEETGQMMSERFRQLGKEKAQKINDIAMKALQS